MLNINYRMRNKSSYSLRKPPNYFKRKEESQSLKKIITVTQYQHKLRHQSLSNSTLSHLMLSSVLKEIKLWFMEMSRHAFLCADRSWELSSLKRLGLRDIAKMRLSLLTKRWHLVLSLKV